MSTLISDEITHVRGTPFSKQYRVTNSDGPVDISLMTFEGGIKGALNDTEYLVAPEDVDFTITDGPGGEFTVDIAQDKLDLAAFSGLYEYMMIAAGGNRTPLTVAEGACWEQREDIVDLAP